MEKVLVTCIYASCKERAFHISSIEKQSLCEKSHMKLKNQH